MGLLYAESFDNIVTTSILLTKYDAASAMVTGALSNAQARTGSYSLKIYNADTLAKTPVDPAASGGTFIFGCAIFIPTGSYSAAASPYLLSIREGSTVHCQVGIDATMHPTFYRNTTLLGTSSSTITQNSWVYLEVKVVISDTVGTYEVRLDNTNVLSASSQDTRNGGTGVWDNYRMSSPFASAGFLYLDDKYVADGSGSGVNNFLGIQRVDSVLPKTDASGAGFYGQWTPSTSTDHGALVDESTPNGDTDYNSSSTTTQRDTYKPQTLSPTGQIRGVVLNAYVRKTASGARTIKLVTRSNSVNYDGASISPGTNYALVHKTRDVDPNTSAAWTNTNWNASEGGVLLDT